MHSRSTCPAEGRRGSRAREESVGSAACEAPGTGGRRTVRSFLPRVTFSFSRCPDSRHGITHPGSVFHSLPRSKRETGFQDFRSV